MERYAWPLRLFHWLLAGLVLVQLGLILGFGQLESLAYGQFALTWHRSVGVLILILVAARLAAGFVVKPPAPIADVPKWQRRAAKAVHAGLLLLLVVQSAAGLVLAGARGDQVSLFGLVDLPPLVAYDADRADQLLTFHRMIGGSFAALLAVHLGAVGYHRIVAKRDVLRRMFVAPDFGPLVNRLPIWSQVLTVCLVLLCLTFGIGFYAVANTKAAGRQSAAAFAEVIAVGGHLKSAQAAFNDARLARASGGAPATVIAPLATARAELSAAGRAATQPDVRAQAEAAVGAVRDLQARLQAGTAGPDFTAAAGQIDGLADTESAATERAKVEADQASAGIHDLILLSILPAVVAVLALSALLSSNIVGWVQRARSQAAASAEQAKTEFLANLSHEIRTPLNGVLGLVDALSGAKLTPSQRDLARTIAHSAGALNSLLVDVLDFSRLESGEIEIVEKTFRLGEVIAESGALFEPAAREKGLGFSVHLGEGADQTVRGDPARLRQILTNLLSNALKFTPAGEITVSVTTLAPDSYQIDVRDTGIGFDPADADHLFERFVQADGSITRRYGGTGLGLAICRELAGLMGGRISATSMRGCGSTFSLVLPLPAADELAPPPASGEVTEVDDSQPLRVLVTDDNATNRKVAEAILGAVGADVAFAQNGLEAVQAVEREAFDVVLMDLQMPVMDGLTAIRAIRAREAAHGLPRLPIIVVSANAMPEQVAASCTAGADGHLGKPIRAETLVGAIVSALQAGHAATQSPKVA